MTTGTTAATTDDTALDKTFSAVLQKSPAPGGWTYAVTAWKAEGDTVTIHLSRRLAS